MARRAQVAPGSKHPIQQLTLGHGVSLGEGHPVHETGWWWEQGATQASARCLYLTIYLLFT